MAALSRHVRRGEATEEVSYDVQHGFISGLCRYLCRLVSCGRRRKEGIGNSALEVPFNPFFRPSLGHRHGESSSSLNDDHARLRPTMKLKSNSRPPFVHFRLAFLAITAVDHPRRPPSCQDFEEEIPRAPFTSRASTAERASVSCCGDSWWWLSSRGIHCSRMVLREK